MKNKSIKVMRSTARVLSLMLILLTMTFVIADLLSEENPDSEPVAFAMILSGVFILGGLGLALKWELIGALISIIGFIGIGILNPDALTKPMMYLFPLTAILFLICWWLSKSSETK